LPLSKDGQGEDLTVGEGGLLARSLGLEVGKALLKRSSVMQYTVVRKVFRSMVMAGSFQQDYHTSIWHLPPLLIHITHLQGVHGRTSREREQV
jgi:hypothetical protein